MNAVTSNMLSLREATVAWIRVVLFLSLILTQGLAAQAQDDYLRWSLKQAEEIGKSMRVTGRVGGLLDGRVIHTEESYNFKLRATKHRDSGCQPGIEVGPSAS